MSARKQEIAAPWKTPRGIERPAEVYTIWKKRLDWIGRLVGDHAQRHHRQIFTLQRHSQFLAGPIAGSAIRLGKEFFGMMRTCQSFGWIANRSDGRATREIRETGVLWAHRMRNDCASLSPSEVDSGHPQGWPDHPTARPGFKEARFCEPEKICWARPVRLTPGYQPRHSHSSIGGNRSNGTEPSSSGSRASASASAQSRQPA